MDYLIRSGIATWKRGVTLQLSWGTAKAPGRRPGRYREIDLHAVGALVETAPDIGYGFADQVRKEGLARVPRNLRRRIKQA